MYSSLYTYTNTKVILGLINLVNAPNLYTNNIYTHTNVIFGLINLVNVPNSYFEIISKYLKLN